MGLLKEFKEFAVKGNMVDMAVGIIIGAAFGKLISSLVADLMMPPLGMLMGQMDFSQYAITLADAGAKPDGTAIPPVLLRYGAFINVVIDFLIVAIAVFILVKLINQLRRTRAAEPSAEPPAPTAQEKLLAEIRDLLRAGR
jgi:large conductance mechanosensitive channel